MGDSWYNHDDMQQGRASEVCVGDVWQGSLRTGDASAPTALDVEMGFMPVTERFYARYRSDPPIPDADLTGAKHVFHPFF